MIMEESWLHDLNPDTLRAVSLQAQLPSCLRFSGLEPEKNLSLVKLLMFINLESPAPMHILQKNPVSPANGSAGLANDPKITGATAAGELQKIPAEYGLPKDDQSCNSKREFESSHFNPANERSPVQDATKDCLTLVDGITQPKENHKKDQIQDLDLMGVGILQTLGLAARFFYS
ncbi:hypothetical protein DSO57_1021204 [Entomophthora muscae]|uniref:Uncharacterized protein n=1 Tax=Entomophthora muscae TaxID=34485 RepID=A0ACC2U1B9_9FUNG|nr:hypothetical protein DSO57_1021204 [Entomophthora muscae]